MSRLCAGAVAAALVALSTPGCMPQEEVATQLPSMRPVEYVGLRGSSWQVVAFRSNDDSQPVVRPTDPSVYTLDFNADGTLNLRLDCNRGSGNWNASQDGRATSGSITMGQLAVTRAMCPNPAVGDQLARDWPHITGYLVRNNQLYLSLMADAGTWEFAPRVR